MSELAQCDACRGFLPKTGGACPHCGLAHVTRGPLGKRVAALVTAAAASAFGVTLMACYGPATGYDYDSGRFNEDASTDVTTDAASDDGAVDGDAGESDASESDASESDAGETDAAR